jgi:hypothetical protein
MADPATGSPLELARDTPVRSAGALCCGGGATFDDDLRLGEAVEDLPVEQLVPEFRVEVLAVAVLPR